MKMKYKEGVSLLDFWVRFVHALVLYCKYAAFQKTFYEIRDYTGLRLEFGGHNSSVFGFVQYNVHWVFVHLLIANFS